MDVTLEPGQQFADYTIEALLGRGGMGEVYQAEHLRMGRRAALKVLAPEVAGDQEFSQRFVRECRIAAQLDHPNILPIFDAGEAGGRLYIAMRYVEGTDLREVIRSEGPLAPDRAFALLRQVAEALDAVHAQGVVHRDVKPANILVEGAGEGEHVWLCDFGLGVRVDATSQLTRSGETFGTAAYMAPEQAAGEPADPRADAYALGCMLFECLTGHPPYRGDNLVATIAEHLHAPVPAISAVCPELGTELDAVFQRALAKAPADRYPSCGALLAAAQRASGVQPGMTGMASPWWLDDSWDGSEDSAAVEAADDVIVRYAPAAGPPPAAGGLQPPDLEPPPRRRNRTPLAVGALALAAVVLATAGTLAFAATTGDEPQRSPGAAAVATTSAPPTTAPPTTAAAPPTSAPPTTAAVAGAAPAPAAPNATEAPTAPATETSPATEPPETHPPETHPPATEPPETTEPPGPAVNDGFQVDSGSKECPSGGSARFTDSGPGKPGNGKSNDDYIVVIDACKNGHGVKAWAWLNGRLLGARYNGNGMGADDAHAVVWDPFPNRNVRAGDSVGVKICEVDGNKDETPSHCRSHTEKSADG